VGQEKQGTVADPGEPGAEAALEAVLFVFLLDLRLDLLPFDAEGRVGEHEVEVLTRAALH
jgi:hypothetical protein